MESQRFHKTTLVCEKTDKNPFSLHTMWLKLINFIFASKQNKKQVQLSIYCPILKDELSSSSLYLLYRE